jgi:hypothetical protein
MELPANFVSPLATPDPRHEPVRTSVCTTRRVNLWAERIGNGSASAGYRFALESYAVRRPFFKYEHRPLRNGAITDTVDEPLRNISFLTTPALNDLSREIGGNVSSGLVLAVEDYVKYVSGGTK